MTPLRQQMIDAMRQRGFSIRTHKSYLGAVQGLARYFHTPPDQLKPDQIQDYFVYLVQEKGLANASCRMYLHGMRFLYLQVLHWPQFDIPIQYPKRARRIPELLTRAEVKQIADSCPNDKSRTMVLTCYGCGLRVSELVALKVHHIDGERGLLRIEQAKGQKDRLVVLPPSLLQHLRHYWRLYHPGLWLFPNSHKPNLPLGISTAQRHFTNAKGKTRILKVGGIHSLRHAYATHQLEQGLPVHQLQHQLGHRQLQTTLRYVHWVSSYQQGSGVFSDLIDQLEPSHD
ncbi:MAG: tyrosine-type recombinase/integrase [Gammaproteobacteria bacterium]|nr:tyrosine-type recombinase/integrase [Gammaproteobacteria bacterium]